MWRIQFLRQRIAITDAAASAVAGQRVSVAVPVEQPLLVGPAPEVVQHLVQARSCGDLRDAAGLLLQVLVAISKCGTSVV